MELFLELFIMTGQVVTCFKCYTFIWLKK